MSVFSHLALEKRKRIIDGAMSVFAVHGYAKASVSDIASRAGISKAMVFTYFGSKRGCYEFLCEEMLRVSVAKYSKYHDRIFDVTDYFDRVILSSQIKIEILKQCPSLLSFAMSVFRENDEEVAEKIQSILSEAYALRKMLLTTGIDESKLKNPEDCKLIGKLVSWVAEGCASEWMRTGGNELDGSLKELTDSIQLLKNRFYREEYL